MYQLSYFSHLVFVKLLDPGQGDGSVRKDAAHSV